MPMQLSLTPCDTGRKACDEAGGNDVAAIADWFARLFIAPPERALVNACGLAGSGPFLILTQIGAMLQQQELSRKLVHALKDKPVEAAVRTLSYHYVMLFDGMAGPAATPPYESFFMNENGRLCQQPETEMRRIMRALDVSPGRWNEPADHLGLQLALFAEALRQKNRECANRIGQRLKHWLPMLSAAIQRAAPASFYGGLVTLLIAFLSFFCPLPVKETGHPRSGEQHAPR